MIAIVGIPAQVTDAIGHRVRVAVRVEADEHSERASRLRGDDATERKLAEETVLWRSGSKIGDEAVANVLVRVGAFERTPIEILRRADESGECSVINRVRESVVGIETEVSSESFDCLQGQSVVDRISTVVGEI